MASIYDGIPSGVLNLNNQGLNLNFQLEAGTVDAT